MNDILYNIMKSRKERKKEERNYKKESYIVCNPLEIKICVVIIWYCTALLCTALHYNT